MGARRSGCSDWAPNPTCHCLSEAIVLSEKRERLPNRGQRAQPFNRPQKEKHFLGNVCGSPRQRFRKAHGVSSLTPRCPIAGLHPSCGLHFCLLSAPASTEKLPYSSSWMLPGWNGGSLSSLCWESCRPLAFYGCDPLVQGGLGLGLDPAWIKLQHA